jgi:protein tyrosine/serine phosphatase
MVAGLVCPPARAVDPNPPGWPNFHQVNGHIYRGGLPSSEGWTSLADLGVKTVIDLRQETTQSAERERRAVEAAGMRYVLVPLSGLAAPSPRDISKLLDLLVSESNWPIFVHRQRGSDRTGTVIACYRIAHDHWDNQKALAEAGSFGMSRAEIAMRHFILHFRN